MEPLCSAIGFLGPKGFVLFVLATGGATFSAVLAWGSRSFPAGAVSGLGFLALLVVVLLGC